MFFWGWEINLSKGKLVGEVFRSTFLRPTSGYGFWVDNIEELPFMSMENDLNFNVLLLQVNFNVL